MTRTRSPIPGASSRSTAALDFLAESPVAPGRHRYAVLGDMLELGPDEERLHREIGAKVAGV
ncbi:MAG: hypothetical protein ACXWWU_06765, partial [Candidatus Limnocylindria bacterium]